MSDTIAAELRLPLAALRFEVRPETISQRTVEQVTGVHAAAYLEALPRFRDDGGEVMRLGKLRLVNLAAFLAWLARQSKPHADAPANDVEDEPTGLAEELGLVPTAPARRRMVGRAAANGGPRA